MAKYDPVKQKDWQIAEIAEAEMIPFDAMCDKLEIPKDERIPHGQKIGRVDYMKCLEPPEEQTRWQVHRSHRHHPHSPGRRQIHHLHGPDRGPGQTET